MKALFAALQHWLYPQSCLSCQKVLDDNHLLCQGCLSSLQLLSPYGRCALCFFPLSRHRFVCDSCHKYPIRSMQLAAVFEWEKVPFMLSLRYRQTHNQRLLFAMAACTVMQLIRLNWPWPSVVVSPRKEALFAKTVAKIMQIPFTLSCARLIKGRCALAVVVNVSSLVALETFGMAIKSYQPKSLFGLSFMDSRHG